jgi:hypothetical protein
MGGGTGRPAPSRILGTPCSSRFLLPRPALSRSDLTSLPAPLCTGVPKEPGVAWDLRYAKLLSFVRRTGHARVPERHVEEGVQLGQWVRTQRRLHRSWEAAARAGATA